MSRPANAQRGEACIAIGHHDILLRPTFAALVTAEEELGSLFTLVERAAAGQLKLSEMIALLWHCRFEAPDDLQRDAFAEAVAINGLASTTSALKTLLSQILAGR